MTINATQSYVKEHLDGLTSSYYKGKLTAFIRPFVPGNVKMHTPQLYVWGSIGGEKRTTIPRGVPGVDLTQITPTKSGWKEANYSLRIWLVATDMNSDVHGDEKFPILQETVKKQLRALTAPVKLVDPTTRDVSFLMNIGEDMDWDYDVDRTTGDQRILRSAALLTCSVMEVFQS